MKRYQFANIQISGHIPKYLQMYNIFFDFLESGISCLPVISGPAHNPAVFLKEIHRTKTREAPRRYYHAAQT